MFWDRFYDLCVKRGTKPNPVAKAVNISSGLISKWKSTSTLPSGENLTKIANYLDCSVDYLLGRTDEIKITAEPDEKAQQLLNAFYELNQDGRVKLLEEAIMMNASGFYRNNESIQIAARTGHTTSTVVDNLDDYPDAPDNI